LVDATSMQSKQCLCLCCLGAPFPPQSTVQSLIAKESWR
jgi:hypothetical protein